jgi:tRNA threonylcarbamoyladenosine biosynthesis protein TsaE
VSVMQKNEIIYTEQQLPMVAKKILEQRDGRNIIAFYGELGAGKTTLINAICNILEVEDTVTSPSFAIINEYRSGQEGIIYHFDFYRIKDIIEAFDIGFEDYIYSGKFCFIEWAEKIESLLPEERMNIHIAVLNKNERKAVYDIL